MDNAKSNIRKAHHPYKFKENIIKRINRIEGQVRGIARMVGEDVYCDDILHQISSIESALNGVKTALLEAHVKGCVVEQIREGSDEVIDELTVTLRKFLK